MLRYSDMENYYQQLNYIFQNVEIAFGFLGLLNQLLIICVFQRKHLRTYSYAFYSILMTLWDVILCLQAFRHWTAFMFDADIYLVTQFFCTIGEYLPYIAATSSLWILIFISLDRLVTIVYSNRFQLLKKRWFQAVLVMIVIVCNLLIYIQFPLNYKLIIINGTNQTACSIPYNVFNIQIWIFLVNVLLILGVFINILNFKMIRYLIKTRNGLNLNNTNRRSVIRDRKFAFSAIGLNFANFLSKIPFGISLLASNYLALSRDQVKLLFTLCVTLGCLYYALSFPIYMLVNSIFYDEFFKMIGLRKNGNSNSLNNRLAKIAKK